MHSTRICYLPILFSSSSNGGCTVVVEKKANLPKCLFALFFLCCKISSSWHLLLGGRKGEKNCASLIEFTHFLLFFSFPFRWKQVYEWLELLLLVGLFIKKSSKCQCFKTQDFLKCVWPFVRTNFCLGQSKESWQSHLPILCKILLDRT